MKTVLILLMLIIAWPIASQKIDEKELDSAIYEADKIIETDARIFFKNVESFIVFYDSQIIFEKYYHGTEHDSLHHLQSQTKSIVGLLLGIAIDKGYISSENEPINKYFPAYFTPGDSLKSKLTIKDILTMTAGFDWQEMIPVDDPENDNMNMFNSQDYLNYILSKPVLPDPNPRFNYNSGCPMIIAGIIEKATNMPLDRFAESFLFKPLHIANYRWVKDTTGFCHAGGGLYLKPMDVVKIGVMVLNSGRWEGHQVVSEDWIKKAVHPYYPTNFDIGYYGYFGGLGRWTLQMAKQPPCYRLKALEDRSCIFSQHTNSSYPSRSVITALRRLVPFLSGNQSYRCLIDQAYNIGNLMKSSQY